MADCVGKYIAAVNEYLSISGNYTANKAEREMANELLR